MINSWASFKTCNQTSELCRVNNIKLRLSHHFNRHITELGILRRGMEFKAKEPAHGGLPLWARPAKTLFLAMRLLWQTARELESTNWMPVQEPLRLFKYAMRGIKAEGVH